ncbi:hypothetical protein AHF37_10503 [Paragonimus kellicotti]|nr:hypothetical protein AHF37_10503 [Paragonimus kellicotti]
MEPFGFLSTQNSVSALSRCFLIDVLVIHSYYVPCTDLGLATLFLNCPRLFSFQNGWTALHWAAQRCHADIVELLLDHGASRSAEDLRGDMPCDVTNDLGLRECLFPDPIYPNIVSNGYATTDEDDSENDMQCKNDNSPPKPHLNGFVLP